jgi:tetratricopeptide (TPR) repeat protein
LKPTPATLPLRCAAGLLLASLVVSAATAGTAMDKIWLKGAKEPQIVRVTGESVDGTQLKFSIAGILRVEYGDAPFSFKEAHQHREQGRYEEAIRLYEAALRSKLVADDRRFWLEPNCLYYIALCRLEEGGDIKAAEAAFAKLLSAHPKTRFLPDATLGLGRVQFDQQKYTDAMKRFDELARVAAEKNWEGWLYRAYLWKSRCLRELKRYDDAIGLISKIVGGAKGEKFEDIYVEARVEEAILHMARGKHDKAVDLLRGLIKRIAAAVADEVQKGADTRVQRIEARCFNTLGQCYLAMAKSTSDKKKAEGYLREAQLSFLWTVVLYQRLPVEHAEALFYGAECFEKLDQRPRATELRNELIQRYPDTPFARKVRPAKASR